MEKYNHKPKVLLQDNNTVTYFKNYGFLKITENRNFAKKTKATLKILFTLLLNTFLKLNNRNFEVTVIKIQSNPRGPQNNLN